MKTTDKDRGSRRVFGYFGSAANMGYPGSADWTIQRTALGQYTLRWSPPFRAPPLVTLTPNSYAIFVTSVVTPDSATLLGYAAASGAAYDTGANFILEGRP